MSYDDISLDDWAKEWRSEHLTDETKRLLNQLKFDLIWGPCQEEDYLGWEIALARINEVLEELPKQLYINSFFETWQENEPEPEDCPECNATSYVACVGHPDEDCPDCDGTGLLSCPNCEEGKLDPCWEDWTKVERKQLVQAIVSKELAEYLK